MLATSITGDANGLPPVVLAHGLFGSGKNLGGIARRLSGTRQVISVDMRNHGDSPQSEDHSYAALAADLAEVIAAHGGQADVVGHSMGGKAAMMLALNHPEMLRRLVAIDIAPYAYAHTQVGLIDAMEAMDLNGLRLRSEADARLAKRIKDPGVRAFLLQSLDLKSDPARWKFNLPVLRAQMDTLVGWPDGAPKGSFNGPVLFLIGGASEYCQPDQQVAVRDYFPQAEIKSFEGAGHWLHAERPAEIGEAIAAFLG